MRSPSPAPLVLGQGRRVWEALLIAGALVALGMIYSVSGGQHGDDESSGSRVLASKGPVKLRRYEPSAVAAGPPAPTGSGPWRRAQDPCAFQYPGPLRLESMDCFMEYFPAKLPFYQPVMAASRYFTLGGIQWESGPPPVPIFVLFKDRVSVLMETLRSFWRYIGTPYELIIFNDNTTYPAAVRFLDRLAASGVKVHDNKREWGSFDELYEIVADFVEGYMNESSKSDYFVLTDPDCALDSSPWNILQVYQAALEGAEEKGVDVVGAALRWDDYPERMHIPKENWDGYHELNYAKLPSFPFLHDGLITYNYMKAPVVSTFAMYRRGTRLQRLGTQSYIRMLPPLGARHLDFYLEKGNLPADYQYYHGAARAKAVNARPLVTFIIPSKGRPTIKDTIESLLAQTDPRWNAVIVFDGDQGDAHVPSDPRIKSYTVPKMGEANHGAALRNHGMSQAQWSEWFAFVDDDDVVSPDYVARVVEEVRLNPQVETIIFRMCRAFPTETERQVLPPKEHEMFYWGFVGISFAITRALFESGFEFQPSGLEDFELLEKLHNLHAKMVISPYVTYYVKGARPADVDEEFPRHYIN